MNRSNKSSHDVLKVEICPNCGERIVIANPTSLYAHAVADCKSKPLDGESLK